MPVPPPWPRWRNKRGAMGGTAPDPLALADAVRAGSRRALARAITLVESTRAQDRDAAAALIEALGTSTGQTLRLGVSGAPGVGKSSFIEAFGLRAIAAGRRVAVLAVDPSSKHGGGSILGDKTRMPALAASPHAFIRPSPAGERLGGVARRTAEAIGLVEAAGFDLVIVETVGVGQSETAVADLVDLFLLLIAPGGGDELQGIKRGIVELADLVIVTKADGALAAAASRAVADYRHALGFLRREEHRPRPEVVAISALERRGLDEVERAIKARHEAMAASGARTRRRAAQAKAALWAELAETLLERLRGDNALKPVLATLEARVAAGAVTPAKAARLGAAAFLRRKGKRR